MNITKNDTLIRLKRRILDISYAKKLAHISSCLTALPIIWNIYETKKRNEPFVLSQGHAGLALYVVLEAKYGINAEELYDRHGTHPVRNIEDKIYASTGSLGLGIGIALGMALVNKKQNVYCLISDGELYEGSTIEALNFIKNKEIDNIYVSCNDNGYSGYQLTTVTDFALMFPFIDWHETDVYGYPSTLQGINGHYRIMDENDYQLSIKANEQMA